MVPIAAGGYSGQLRLFDVTSRELLVKSSVGHSLALAFDDHDRLFQGSPKSIQCLEFDLVRRKVDSRQIASIGEASARSIALAENGHLLIGTTADPTQIAIYNIASLDGFHTQIAPWPAVVLAKRGILVAQSSSNEITATQIETGEVLFRTKHQIREGNMPLVISPDGRLLGVDEPPDTLHVVDTKTWQVVHTLALPLGQCARRADFSPNGDWLAVGTDNRQYGVFHLPSGQWRQLSTPNNLATYTGNVDFSPSGLLASAASSGECIELWDVSHNRVVAEVPAGPSVRSMLFLTDGQLAVGDDSGWISFWDPRSAQEIGRCRAYDTSVMELAISPDGRTLASAGAFNHEVKLWRMPLRRELFTLCHANDWVHCLAFEANGDLTFRTNTKTGDNQRLWTFPRSQIDSQVDSSTAR